MSEWFFLQSSLQQNCSASESERPRYSSISMECTCGARYGLNGGPNAVDSLNTRPPPSIDASFVHLFPTLDHKNGSSCLQRYSLLNSLENAANTNDPPELCLECVQRVAEALEADADRLELETLQYRETAQEQALRERDWQNSTRQDEVKRAIQAYEAEIRGLNEACQQQEQELLHLQSVRKEQHIVAEELDRLQEALAAERNAFELEAQAFDHDQEQLQRVLAEIEGEAERLTSPAIRLPAMLFNLQVDKERGRLYPRINELRLAYRPKGDVRWDEIQAAWSLAAQLLLSVGTLFHFQSRHWRIVPLSTCAKLFFYPPSEQRQPIVYNLGHPRTHTSRALLAWNALLHQLAGCVLSQMEQARDDGILTSDLLPKLPFEMTSIKIGSISLTELGEQDDAGWSRAIHCMSSNLLWLSECASAFMLQQVVLSASASKSGGEANPTE